MSESFIVSPPHRHQWLGSGPRRRSASVAPPNNGGQDPRHGLLRLVLALATLGWAIVAPAVVAEAQTPKRDGTLRVSYGNEISALDFHTASGWVAMNIGCGLLGITPDGRFVPDAAESWQISPLYWNTISGSPFYEVARPWMKDYVYNAEWKVLYKKVWLDK
jgi:ABC-type transport system substrate-binding protein